ncbi:Thiol-disulfide oxidoreductase [Sorangium cellulosum]|uniref:Thiol-disulfide oxidoreductase n=1 Tax=Sorangium cellulosum TaxID=56 RepID=A0A2L0F3A9_SORCE|nr:TlpA disulfide reductase family protein [Sorangium cellulosum]AUX46026.1 Thiol-disulfide oxidoreductase [Sorangium cellulosum]
MSRQGILAGALAVAVGLASGCEPEKKADLPTPPTPGQGRSNAVTTPNQAAAGAASTGARAPASAAAPAAPRQLCAGQSPRPAPSSGGLSTASAKGAEPLPANIGFGVGKWVWVNFWAAWCKPCLEEMPRLLGWQQKLRAAGVLIDLAFISIDDDERQLSRFLEAQPGTGVRASYWLPEGPQRTGWLRALGVKEATELPVHAIAAPSGQVTCVIQGAVEDSDYPTIAALVGAKKP